MRLCLHHFLRILTTRGYLAPQRILPRPLRPASPNPNHVLSPRSRTIPLASQSQILPQRRQKKRAKSERHQLRQVIKLPEPRKLPARSNGRTLGKRASPRSATPNQPRPPKRQRRSESLKEQRPAPRMVESSIVSRPSSGEKDRYPHESKRNEVYPSAIKIINLGAS